MDKVRQYLYYILVGAISFLAIAFLPMIGSSQEIYWGLPQTPAAWAIWIVSKVAASTLNVLIYHCFIRQGNLNTKKDPDRLKAEAMLHKLNKGKEKTPISPSKFMARQYIRKVPLIAISTFLSLLAFGPALLMFDFIVFIVYLFSVIISIVFGILEMKHVEEYYTVGLLEYAEWRSKNEEINKKPMDEVHKPQQMGMGTVQRLEDSGTIPWDLSDSKCGSMGVVPNGSDNGQ